MEPAPRRKCIVGYSYPVKILLLIAIILSVAAATALAGCAGGLPDQTSTSLTGPTVPSSTTSSTEPQTHLLADEVAATWAESIQDLVPLLENTPPVASIQAQVADLKEQYIQKMVLIGTDVALLDAEDQQTVYVRATDSMSAMGDAPWFSSYKARYVPYEEMTDAASQEFAVVLASFNTLSEYAFFNLLKEDKPDEASRLGIE